VQRNGVSCNIVIKHDDILFSLTKLQLIHKHSADVVIDKSSSKLWVEAKKAAPKGFAAIFDANGVSTLADSYGTCKMQVYNHQLFLTISMFCIFDWHGICL
jgi:hypothetical protein